MARFINLFCKIKPISKNLSEFKELFSVEVAFYCKYISYKLIMKIPKNG